MKKTIKATVTITFETEGRLTEAEERNTVIRETVRPNLSSKFDGISIESVEAEDVQENL